MSAFLRASSRWARLAQTQSTRSFSGSAVARRDLVQELYLNEIRGYTAPPVAKDAHVGVVKAFSAPSAPSAPAAPTDLASQLAAYDAQEPDLSDASTKGKAAATEIADDTGSGAKEFLAFLEADLPKPEAHHH